MMNYIKSELYRVIHSKGIYILMGICGGLLLAMNLILYFVERDNPIFQYDTTLFSFSMVENSLGIVFILTVCLGCMIFADEYKNKTIMNSIASGYSKTSIYIGKMIVGIIVSISALVIVLSVFIASGCLLLKNSGEEGELILEIIKVFGVYAPILITGLIAAITLSFLIGNVAGATWTWIGLFMGVPMISSLLEMKFAFFGELSKWLVFNLIGNGTVSETQGFVMLWKTQDGLYRCLLAGFMGIAVFLIIGLLGVRRKEIK